MIKRKQKDKYCVHLIIFLPNRAIFMEKITSISIYGPILPTKKLYLGQLTKSICILGVPFVTYISLENLLKS